MSPIPSRWRGRSGREPVELGRGPVHHLVHLRPCPGPASRRSRSRRSALAATTAVDSTPQVALGAALDDPVDGLRRRPLALVPAQAALQPAVGALHRAGDVVAGDVKRRALVEHERDVGAQRGLDRHRGLGADEPLAAVEVGAKAHPLLLDRQDRPVRLGAAARPPARRRSRAAALDLVGDAAVAHREDLKAARVGDDRARPAHELVEPAELGDELGAGREQQVEGVAEHHLVAERGDVTGLERLHRAPGGQRDERRRGHRRGRAAACPARAREWGSRARIVNIRARPYSAPDGRFQPK